MTKHDESRRPDELSPQQIIAAENLATGVTVTATAERLGVSRQTVSGWLNNSPEFRVQLNRLRRDLWTESRDRLRSLLPPALAAVDAKIMAHDADSWKAAIELLKMAKVAEVDLSRPGVRSGIAGEWSIEDADEVIAAMQDKEEAERW